MNISPIAMGGLLAVLTLPLMATAGPVVINGFVNGSFKSGDSTGFTRYGGPDIGRPSYETFLAAQTVSTSKADTNCFAD
jgi:hypothetical protein